MESILDITDSILHLNMMKFEDMPFPVPVALAIFTDRAFFGFTDLDDLTVFGFAGLTVFDLDDLWFYRSSYR